MSKSSPSVRLLKKSVRKVEKNFGLARDQEAKLFKGQDELFIECITQATSYGEYGMGQSTLWVDKYTEVKITSVDTSSEWVNSVADKLQRDQHELTHIDVGPLRKWGYPAGYSHRDKFLDYVEAIWKTRQNHELVLIDGRFRVACFLTCLMRADPGCRIIFDDYQKRRQYHVVEEFLAPIAMNDRQAIFKVPEKRSAEKLIEQRNRFLYVLD